MIYSVLDLQEVIFGLERDFDLCVSSSLTQEVGLRNLLQVPAKIIKSVVKLPQVGTFFRTKSRALGRGSSFNKVHL